MLEADVALRRRLLKLQESNRAILEEHPPEAMARSIHTRMFERDMERRRDRRATSPGFKRMLFPALALTSAIVIFFLAGPPEIGNYNTAQDTAIHDTTRIKGMQEGLYIYRKTDRGPEELRNGSAAKANDLLQVAYISTDRPYGVIVSIDGRGVVTLHYPHEGHASPKLELNRKVLLPRAYQLDDAPGFERFFYISSKTPLSAGSVMAAARELAKDSVRSRVDPIRTEGGMRQISILIEKSAGK
jgi:hypothetical protein